MSVVNQSDLLVMNEHRFRVFQLTERSSIAFVCECPDAECRRTVVMTPSEYEGVRPGLILHPSHAEA